MFLNGDMRHTRVCRGPMPVFLTGRDPDNITLPDFLDWTAPLLNPAGATRHDQSLSQRVGVPSRPGAGLKRDGEPDVRDGSFALNRGSMRTEPVKYSTGPFLEGYEPLRVMLIVFCESSIDAFGGAATIGCDRKNAKPINISVITKVFSIDFLMDIIVSSIFFSDDLVDSFEERTI